MKDNADVVKRNESICKGILFNNLVEVADGKMKDDVDDDAETKDEVLPDIACNIEDAEEKEIDNFPPTHSPFTKFPHATNFGEIFYEIHPL